jgi:hypothetical protein
MTAMPESFMRSLPVRAVNVIVFDLIHAHDTVITSSEFEVSRIRPLSYFHEFTRPTDDDLVQSGYAVPVDFEDVPGDFTIDGKLMETGASGFDPSTSCGRHRTRHCIVREHVQLKVLLHRDVRRRDNGRS